MTNQEILKSLSEIELKVACILHIMGSREFCFGYGDCYWAHNSILCGEGNIPNINDEVGGKKGLSKVLKKLRTLEIVKFMRGLMNEEGEVAGSGHAPAWNFKEDLQAVCDERGWRQK